MASSFREEAKMADPSDEDDVPFEVNVRPDLAKTNQVASFTDGAESKKIRLGCIHCDREDFDGVVEMPSDWHDIFSVQTWKQSIQPVESHDPLQRSALAWETHLGVCPECYEEFDRVETPPKSSLQWQESESDDSDEREFHESIKVHAIIRQIIDRDCHVSESNSNVVRHVISKLRDGYETFRAMSKVERRKFIEQCVEHHGRNYKEYVEVMSGFRYTTEGKGKAGHQISSLPGPEIVKLMRKYKMTINQLAYRLGTSQKRVRQARDFGLVDPYAIRDWIQAICGVDVGPIPEKYRIHNKQEEGECCFCGYPLFNGDTAFEYVSEMFCSITCSRKSRGW
jgi:hypothetical protein